MTLEEKKALVQKFVEAYNKNYDLLDEILAPNYFDKNKSQN